MISFIKGTVSSYGLDWIVVENNGIGWKMSYPHTEHVKLNQSIMVHTYMNVSEQDVSLYGFESIEELDFFTRLISVKGLGPKTAITMLGRSSYEQLVSSIEQGNVEVLKKIPGIGAKTASQIILDLKGKLVASQEGKENYGLEIKEAIEALKNFGYKQGEVTSAAKIMSEKEGLSTEEYVKIGLQYLAKAKMGGSYE